MRRSIKQVQAARSIEEIGDRDVGVLLRGSASELSTLRRSAANIQEDQRIIVVDAGGFVLGLVVDHVNEVLNVCGS